MAGTDERDERNAGEEGEERERRKSRSMQHASRRTGRLEALKGKKNSYPTHTHSLHNPLHHAVTSIALPTAIPLSLSTSTFSPPPPTLFSSRDAEVEFLLKKQPLLLVA